MRPPAWLGLAALALMIVGLVFGFAPVTSNGYDCGSAFRESPELLSDEFGDALRGGDGDSGCDEARQGRQPIAWAALGVAGAFGVVAMMMLPTGRPTSPRSRDSREAGL